MQTIHTCGPHLVSRSLFLHHQVRCRSDRMASPLDPIPNHSCELKVGMPRRGTRIAMTCPKCVPEWTHHRPPPLNQPRAGLSAIRCCPSRIHTAFIMRWCVRIHFAAHRGDPRQISLQTCPQNHGPCKRDAQMKQLTELCCNCDSHLSVARHDIPGISFLVTG